MSRVVSGNEKGCLSEILFPVQRRIVGHLGSGVYQHDGELYSICLLSLFVSYLKQTRNPHAVQPHLRKCFDAIAKLEFGVKEPDEEGGEAKSGEPVLTTDIMGMISPEGERVLLGKGLKARGNVEDWLGKVEDSMFVSLRKIMKASIADFLSRSRIEWVVRHPNQIILSVSQIMWARGVHLILDGEGNKQQELEMYEQKCITVSRIR